MQRIWIIPMFLFKPHLFDQLHIATSIISPKKYFTIFLRRNSTVCSVLESFRFEFAKGLVSLLFPLSFSPSRAVFLIFRFYRLILPLDGTKTDEYQLNWMEIFLSVHFCEMLTLTVGWENKWEWDTKHRTKRNTDTAIEFIDVSGGEFTRSIYLW